MAPVNVTSAMLSIAVLPKNIYALPARFPPALLLGAPTITSLYPSPFTSPVEETEYPKLSPAAAPVNVTSAMLSIAAPPKYIYALPASVPPASLYGAPTITSLYPSPFTSPAEETELPK